MTEVSRSANSAVQVWLQSAIAGALEVAECDQPNQMTRWRNTITESTGGGPVSASVVCDNDESPIAETPTAALRGGIS